MKKLMKIILLLLVFQQTLSASLFGNLFNSDAGVVHIPQYNETHVSKDVIIKITYGEDIDQSCLSNDNVILTQLSSGEQIQGTFEYVEEEKTILFTPIHSLEHGSYHIKYKNILKKGLFLFFKKYIFETVEFSFEVSQAIVEIKLDKASVELNENNTTSINVYAGYDDNTSENITNEVEWLIGDNDVISIENNNTIIPIKEGVTTLQAKYKTFNTEEITVEIYKEINGYRLPLEPDETLNNSTLLGIDSNDNGVRDDVERKIVLTYQEPIKIEPLMAAVKVGQEILANPVGLAREHSDKMDKVSNCWSYISEVSPNLIDELTNVKFYENNMYNTEERIRTYIDYNRALSGGVYGSGPADWTADKCGFDVEAMLKGVK